MTKRALCMTVAMLFFGAIAVAGSPAQKKMSEMGTKTYYGVVTDTHCGLKHSMASAMAEGCVEKCVAGGAKYALVYHHRLYQVEPQEKFSGLGGKRVKVTGSLSNGTITADTVTALASKRHMKKTSS